MKTSEVRGDLDDAVRGVERAKLLCNQLLAFSLHHQEGQQVLNLEAELSSLTHLLRSVIPENTALEFSSELSDVSTIGNRAQLQQVLMNLILDAVQAAIDVHEARIEVRLDRIERNERYWCEIRIHGPRGAAPDLRAHFDKSIGLGLEKGKMSLTRIVRSHDGVLTIDDGDEVTASVTLLLPLAPTRRPAPASVVVPRAFPGGVALVIDDEYQVRQVAVRMLTQAGYEVSAAASADEGIGLFERTPERFDVVVLDLKMPGKDGWSCLRELRGIRSTIPVVIVSGFDPDETRRETFAEPLVFIAKPFRRRELIDAVGVVRRHSVSEVRSERVS